MEKMETDTLVNDIITGINKADALIDTIINEINTVNTVCTLCSLNMENNQPRTQLMCHHTFHTACFLSEIFVNGGNYCCFCNQQVFTHETRQGALDKDRQLHTERVKKRLEMFQENHEAVADLKLIKKQITKAKKARSLLNNYMRVQRTEHKEEAEQLSKLLKDMIEKRKKKVMTSEEHTNWKSEKIRLQRYLNVFNQKYQRMSYHELADIPQLKLPSHWHMRRIIRFDSWRFYRYFR
jgi:hypothetical protein